MNDRTKASAMVDRASWIVELYMHPSNGGFIILPLMRYKSSHDYRKCSQGLRTYQKRYKILHSKIIVIQVDYISVFTSFALNLYAMVYCAWSSKIIALSPASIFNSRAISWGITAYNARPTLRTFIFLGHSLSCMEIINPLFMLFLKLDLYTQYNQV